jgi:PD-(D/E)XK nuclease superfamily
VNVSAGYRDYLTAIRGNAAEEARGSSPARWNLPIDHWSPSSLAMLRRCPYQWQQRYIHGRKERPAEAPVIGTAVHAGLERNFDQKIESHVDIPTVELVNWFTDEGWDTCIRIEQERRGDEILWDTSPDEAKTRGTTMLAAYRNVVAPRIQPTSVEGAISVDFGLAVPVEGRFDILRDESCIDIKTGKRAQKKPKEAWRIQAAVYGHATGKPVEFHSLSATERNAVTIVTPLDTEDLLVNPDEQERARMVYDLRAVSAEACMYMEIFGPDQPWPTHGRFHDWACSYCGFRKGCPAWSSEE